jgi:hypothetical protein
MVSVDTGPLGLSAGELEDTLMRLHDVLEETVQAASAVCHDGALGSTFTVEASSAQEAAKTAAESFLLALELAGLPGVELEHLEANRELVPA